MNCLSALKETASLRLFAALKIPLIAHLRPLVIELDDERCVVRFPLRRRSRNHLGSMYFAALCAGADCAAGLPAMKRIQASQKRISFVFKDVAAEFLARADGDVDFTCSDGKAVRELIEQAERSTARLETTVSVVATVPAKHGDAPVARFRLTMSVKQRDEKP